MASTERNVVDFKIHNLTEEQFQELKAQGKLDPNAVYCTPDESLKTDQITNCITEIPQDIKYTFVDGKLTILAGSVIYIPNGNGVFNKRTLTSNLSTTGPAINAAGTIMVFIREDTGGFKTRTIDKCSSGTASPGTAWSAWWDTTNNVINNYDSNASTPTGHLSLPLMAINVVKSEDSVYTITEVKQVFNGFGYMGSTVFVLPGVKGLAPDGRNEDGALRNKTITTTRVIAYTRTVNGGKFVGCITGGAAIDSGLVNYVESETQPTANYTVWYKPSENRMYYVVNGVATATTRFVTWKETRNTSAPYNITLFEPKTTFHAVDYNNFEALSDTVETLSDTVGTNNNNAVHKAGDETIGGIKTFQSAPVSGNGGYITKTTYAKGSTLSNVQYFWSNVTYDKNGTTQANKLSQDYVQVNQDGTIKRVIAVFKNTSGETVSDGIEIGYNAAGQMFTKVPTPAANDNSTKIATTAWANAKFLPLSGGQISGDVDMTGRQINVGRIELKPTTTSTHGGFIDFHYAGTTDDYTSRIMESASGQISITATNGLMINGNFAPSMPSNAYVDLTLGASGTTYTAPADGWYTVRVAHIGKGQILRIINNSNALDYQVDTVYDDSVRAAYMPVKKGQTVKINYSGGSKENFRFIYAEGSKHSKA